MYYAHAVIEKPDGTRYQRGDEVDAKTVGDGFDELVEAGSISEEAYDAVADKSAPPKFVEVGGVRYVQVSDGAETSGDAS